MNRDEWPLSSCSLAANPVHETSLLCSTVIPVEHGGVCGILKPQGFLCWTMYMLQKKLFTICLNICAELIIMKWLFKILKHLTVTLQGSMYPLINNIAVLPRLVASEFTPYLWDYQPVSVEASQAHHSFFLLRFLCDSSLLRSVPWWTPRPTFKVVPWMVLSYF